MGKIIKKIALLLVIVLTLGQTWPAVQAKAASLPGLKYASKVIYIDGDSQTKYDDNCWVPSKNTTGYNVKYQVISNSDLITVSKNGKVIATGNGVGAAVVKVTYSKAGEKDITENFTVKVRRNAVDVKLTSKSLQALEQPINIGDKVTFEAAKSADGSYAKGHYGLDNYRGVVNDSLRLESLTPEIATVNGLTLTGVSAGTARFVVRAYQYGENKFTGVQSITYTIEVTDPQPTPTPTPVVTVKQTSTTTIELSTNTTYTSAPAINSIKLNKIVSSTSMPMDIRNITLGDTDKTKLIIETYALMNDNTKYEIVFNDEKYEFTCSDGKIASLGITPLLIEEMVETEIFVSCYDKSGVLLGKYNMLTAYTIEGLSLEIDSVYGYSTGEKYALSNIGNTAKAKAVYRTGQYDSYTGNEIGTITKEETITAIKATAVAVGSHKYTVASYLPSYSSSSFTVNNFIEVGQQDKYIYFYITNSRGEDVSYEYTLSSSNIDALIVGETIVQSTGIMASINAVSALATDAYVIFSKNNSPAGTLRISIRAEAKVSRMELDKTSLTLSSTSTSSEIVKMSLYDQYGQKMNSEYSYPTVTLLSAPTSMKTQVENNLYTYAVPGDSNVSFCAVGLDTGSYSFRVQYGDYTRAVTISVVKPNEQMTSTYRLVLSDNSIDAAVASTDSSNKELTFRVAEYKGSVLYRYLSVSEVTPSIKDSSGNTHYYSTQSGTSDTWVFTVTDLGKTPVEKKAKGTYTISVTYDKKEYKQTFSIADTQAGVVAGLVSATVTNPGTWRNALDMAFDFTYLGSNVDSAITAVSYTINGKNSTASSDSSISAGAYYNIIVTLNVPVGSYIVPLTVSLGRTITVK